MRSPLYPSNPHNYQGHTAPAAGGPECLLRRMNGARVIRPGPPARPRPAPGSCIPEALRFLRDGPARTARRQRLGQGARQALWPSTHRPAAAAAAAAARPLDQAGGVGRPAGRGAAPARTPLIGCCRPGPAPYRPCPLTGLRKGLRPHVRLLRPFGQSYVIRRTLGPRVWRAVQDCVTGREPHWRLRRRQR